jgi:RNA polymerase sigma-70 factor (ECF subfamily)
MEFQDEQIALRLSKRDEAAFEQVFKTHYKNLHAYAFTILRDEDEAEEMVQQVFFKLWERSEHLSFSGSIAAYLYRAVHNESLNFIKHQKVKADHQMHVAYSMKNRSEQAQPK